MHILKFFVRNYSIRFFILLQILTLLIAFSSCHNKSNNADEISENKHPLFSLLPSSQTHIDFSNTLTEGLNTNVLMYEYFYNGGGVAIGDVNGDGLQDIYFSGNMVDNKLYLNKGNMQFEDITNAAGVAGQARPVENRCYDG